jgi:hypothetical protein
MINMDIWKRGFVFHPEDNPELRMYLWFYEWHLFDAFEKGQHTSGTFESDKTINPEKSKGSLNNPAFVLNAEASEDGALLDLTVFNKSEHEWPEIAAMIPCFNPGYIKEVSETEVFFDDGHERTWFLGKNGLENLVKRDIHFNHEFREQIDAEADKGGYEFSHKWPTSSEDSYGGLLLRESSDKEWVAAISWETFISLQGHNPWRCMHHSIRVGPLPPGESKNIKGRIYFFKGTKEECLGKYRKEFNK